MEHTINNELIRPKHRLMGRSVGLIDLKAPWMYENLVYQNTTNFWIVVILWNLRDMILEMGPSITVSFVRSKVAS